MPSLLTATALLALLLSCCDSQEEDDTAPEADADSDGWTVADGDCDDADPAVHPGADERIADGIDQDCDGGDTCWQDTDVDGDGWSWTETVSSKDLDCTDPGESAFGGDCDDADPAVHPDANDVINGIDDDCDGFIDEGPDADSDGWTVADGDCDDRDRSVHPGASERVADGIDQDCDGGDTCWQDTDVDGDGWAGTETVSSEDLDCTDPCESAFGGDCDDVDLAVHPDAEEVCEDGVDNNCDGRDSRCDLSGEISLLTADAKLLGEQDLDFVGIPITTGDVDGDGKDDVLIGTSWEDTGGTGAGAVYLVLGPASGTSSLSEAEAKFVGEDEHDCAGSLASGDMNGDGFDDVLIGADGEDTGGYDAGAAYLVLGPASGVMDLSLSDAKLFGEDDVDNAGEMVSMGDLDGDGFDDALIGASNESTGARGAGAVYLVRGPVTGVLPLSSADAKLLGEHSLDSIGGSALATGDVDGDGFDDALIGSYLADTSARHAGVLYLVQGPVSGIVSLAEADARFAGEYAGDCLGASAAAGDVNGDGFEDILVGAFGHDVDDFDVGAAYLLLGDSSPMDRNLSEADAKYYGES
ncbi:MAG: FG-GAP repeat protein, partial [Deltaproteobacteria bacterium]|nr:FG-GAP repeat protein [Deltaproteobacteria bacterium]